MSEDLPVTTIVRGVDVQHLVTKLDSVANALATVDANAQQIAEGLAQIEALARHCEPGLEFAALLRIEAIARRLR